MMTMLQSRPYPVYEVDHMTPRTLAHDLIEKDFPDDMGLSYRGMLYRFRTREERIQFALGMLAILDHEED